jgi:hypothetical protein
MKKINVFYASMGGAALLLLAGYLVLVYPKGADQAKVQRSLGTLVKGLETELAEAPGKPDIDGWKKYRAEALRAYKDITKFYADTDQALERWFPGMQNPDRGRFMTKWRDEGNRLEAELVKMGCAVGVLDGDADGPPEERKRRLGFNWETLEIAHWAQINQAGTDEEAKVLRELQKRFWARQRIANLVLTGGVKASRLVDFRFFKRLHPAVGNAPWEAPLQGREGILYQGVGGGGASRTFQEFDLPNDLGRTMTFGATLELPYSEIPKALREILNPGGQPGANEPLLISLVGAHIAMRGQNEPVVHFEYLKGDKEDEEKKRAAALEKNAARNVLLAVTCQILDFEPSKIQTFDAAASQ